MIPYMTKLFEKCAETINSVNPRDFVIISWIFLCEKRKFMKV